MTHYTLLQTARKFCSDWGRSDRSESNISRRLLSQPCPPESRRRGSTGSLLPIPRGILLFPISNRNRSSRGKSMTQLPFHVISPLILWTCWVLLSLPTSFSYLKILALRGCGQSWGGMLTPQLLREKDKQVFCSSEPRVKNCLVSKGGKKRSKIGLSFTQLETPP